MTQNKDFIKFGIYFSQQDEEILKSIASSESSSVAYLIRKAIKDFIKKYKHSNFKIETDKDDLFKNTIHFLRPDWQVLNNIAEVEDVSASYLVRKAIKDFIKRYK